MASEYGPAEFGSPSHSRKWVKQSELDPRKGTEYGGVEGLIQPPGHDVRASASEQLMLLFNTNPADETSGADLPPLKQIRNYNE